MDTDDLFDQVLFAGNVHAVTGHPHLPAASLVLKRKAQAPQDRRAGFRSDGDAGQLAGIILVQGDHCGRQRSGIDVLKIEWRPGLAQHEQGHF